MRPLTAEEFADLPDDDFGRDELIRGAVCFREPPPGFRHGGPEVRIVHILHAFVTAHRLGEVRTNVGFVFERNPDTVCAPDVSFVEARRLPIGDGQVYLDGAPELAVEIVSPGNTKKDIATHVALYLRTGSRLVWVVSQKRRTVTVYRPNREPVVLGIDDELFGDDVLPGFQYRVAHVFED